MSNATAFSMGQHRYLTVDRVAHRPNIERLQPVGEIDLYTAPVLQRILDDVARRAVRGVVVDMSRVDFLAIAGVRVLYEATEQAASTDRRVVLANSSSLVKRVLVLTKAFDLLNIRDTVADALAELDAPGQRLTARSSRRSRGPSCGPCSARGPW